MGGLTYVGLGYEYRVLNVTSLHTERLHVTCNRRVSWQMVCAHVSGLRGGSWGTCTEYFSTLSGVRLTQEGPWWPSSGPLVIEDGAHECGETPGVQAPAPAWAINSSLASTMVRTYVPFGIAILEYVR